MNINEFTYHPLQEEIVQVLKNKTLNPKSDSYYRLLVCWFFSQMATNLHVSIVTKDRGKLPLNSYSILLAQSGFGKNHGLNILENSFLSKFKKEFLDKTFINVAEKSISKEANFNSSITGNDYIEEEEKLIKEFTACGEFPYSFDSGTTAAFRQVRAKAQIARIGSLSLVMDEIGSNLSNNTDLFTILLDNYDLGLMKNKLLKNSTENVRGKDRNYPIPVNLLSFGTPSKLLDGGKTESEFNQLLATGYARRYSFALGVKPLFNEEITAENRYDALTDSNDEITIKRISAYFKNIADEVNYNINIIVPKNVSIACIEYQMLCEKRAENLPEHLDTLKAEITHRYFKVLKRAGAYAFIDSAGEVNLKHLHNAIKVEEDSGKAFAKIMSREKPYIKLAKYLAQTNEEITHADLAELPFYNGNSLQKKEQLMLAISYGYKNNIIIKKMYSNGVEILQGESLKENHLDQIRLSISEHLGKDYTNELAPFDQLHTLTQESNLHWCNHHSPDGSRIDAKMVAGFNIIVLDVDGNISIDTTKLLLNEYSYHIYTTKRHSTETNRFRIIIPLSHEVKLSLEDYKEFMNNVYSFLPFTSDEQTNQRNKKWLTHKGTYFYNKGKCLDALQFIPKTEKNTQRESQLKDTSDLTNLERWFLSNTGEGNRSNSLIKYGYMLVDSGRDLIDIQTAIMKMNSKLKNGLSKDEIFNTILKSIAKAVHAR